MNKVTDTVENWWEYNLRIFDLNLEEDDLWSKTQVDEILGLDTIVGEIETTPHTAKVTYNLNQIQFVNFPSTPEKEHHKPKRMKKNLVERKTVYSMNFDQIRFGENSHHRKQPDIPKEMINQGAWSEEEIERFFIGFETLGRRWKKISLNFVKTRNTVQVACFGQKYLKSVEK